MKTERSILFAALTAAGDLIARLVRTILGAGHYVATHGERWLIQKKRAVYGLAIGRILLGVTVIGTVLSNIGYLDYVFGGGVAWSGQLQNPTISFATIWPFSLVFQVAPNSVSLHAVVVVLLIVAVLYTIGYRARLMLIPMFVLWVGLLSINSLVQDQSDNLTRMAMIALVFSAPSEVWSIDALRRRKFASNPGKLFLVRWWRFQPVLPAWMTSLSHNLAVVVLGAQLCMIYAAGGLFKAQGFPWYSGTAIYDPLHTAQFGTWPELIGLITAWAPIVALGTVLTVLVQVSFPLLLLRRGTRIIGLLVILVFHVSIAVFMGLPWFSLAMVALDAIFIRDVTYRQIADSVTSAWRKARGIEPTAVVSEVVTPEGIEEPIKTAA